LRQVIEGTRTKSATFALRRKTLESSYPIVLGVTVGLCLIGVVLFTDYSVEGTGLEKNITNVLTSIAAVSGTIVGFLSTALSILFVLSDRPYLKAVSRSGALDELITYIVRSILQWVLLALSSLTGTLFYGVMSTVSFDVLLSITSGLLVTALLSFYRAISLITALLRKQVGYRG
jgi:hypothetical protein